MKFDSDILTYDGGVEIERQVKLFEDISSVNGDYSYSFSIPNTAKNRALLGIRSLNSTAFWNTKIETEILNNSGVPIYRGYLQIESQTSTEIRLSFFSGNTDWFTALNVDLHSLDYPKLSKDWTSGNISSSWSATSGIVFPFINRGGLLTRKSPNYYIDDFQPFVYVKDAIRVILANAGIKLAGDILTDPVYNSLITSNNSSKGIQRRVNQQKVKAGKSSTQSITSATETKITFTDVSDPNYYNSPNGNWSTANSQYTFSEATRKFKVKANIRLENNNAAFLTYLRLYVNSTLVHEVRTFAGDQTVISFEVNSDDFSEVTLLGGVAAGDTLEVRIEYRGLSTTLDVISSSYIEVEPTKYYKIEASQCLPDKKASEFVKDVFSLFNTVISYNAQNKTLTVKKLDNVLRENPVDISEYVNRDSIEYVDFVQNYSKNNYLKYQDQTFDEVEKYNLQDNLPYGHGNIEVINEFLDESADLLESEFISAWQQDVDFVGSLPRFEYVEMIETSESRSITSVTDNSGTARFNFTGSSMNGALVRVKDSTVPEYEGDYEIVVNTAGYVELQGVLYLGDATCTIVELDWQDNDNDDQALLIHKPSVKLSDLGYGDNITAPNLSTFDTIGLAYFYYPDRGTRFSRFKGVGLPFDSVDGNQQGMREAYWRSAERLLNNGVMVRYIAHLPESVFYQLDFLRPVRIVTPDENLVFFVNRITGYKGSQFPCEFELINIQNVQVATVQDQLPTSEVTPDPEPPVETTYYYIADLYECSTCTLFLAGQVVEYTGVTGLALNRWYAEGTYAAFIYNTGSAPSSYTIIDGTVYASCAVVPCLAP
jgi:hypothetical protein